MVQVASELALSGPDWFSLECRDESRSVAADPRPACRAPRRSARARPDHCRPATSREQRRLRTAARRIRKGSPPAPRAAAGLPHHTAHRSRRGTIRRSPRTYARRWARAHGRCTAASSAWPSPRTRARRLADASTPSWVPSPRTTAGSPAPPSCSPRAPEAPSTSAGPPCVPRGAGELAALAHLPAQEAIPGVVMAGAREVAPPPGLPARASRSGEAPVAAGEPLGGGCAPAHSRPRAYRRR